MLISVQKVNCQSDGRTICRHQAYIFLGQPPFATVVVRSLSVRLSVTDVLWLTGKT